MHQDRRRDAPRAGGDRAKAGSQTRRRGDARSGLLQLEREGKIDDDDPEIRDWQASYHWYIDYLSEKLDGNVVTFEVARDRLESIERQLAARHGITTDVRATLIRQLRACIFVEDELVADWYDAYASYLNFSRERGEAPEEAALLASSLYGECHSCKRQGWLKQTEFSREHNPLRGAVCERGCNQAMFETTSR